MAQQNPFGTSGAGANAFKAAYDRLKSEADLSKQNIGQDYASAYQQLRQQGYGMGLGASAQKGLSGGQAEGVRGAISAQQMGQLGNLMQGQEKALREQKVGEQSIYSNALIEGQQGQEMENNRLAQIQQIVTNADGSQKGVEDLTDIEKQRLSALGYDTFGQKTDQPIRTDFTGKTYYASEADARKKAPTQSGTWQLRKIGNEYTWFEVKKYGDIVTNKERATYIGAPVVNK
jgi:hypothetical protein